MTTTATKELPIVMTAQDVRAILEGRKTQTRRVIEGNNLSALKFVDCVDEENEEGDAVVKYLEDGHSGPGLYAWCGEYPEEGAAFLTCPYGQPGERLWVRETWAPVHKPGDYYAIQYGADDHLEHFGKRNGIRKYDNKCRPSIHMPRWVSRILLEVIEVRVERVQEIRSHDDIMAEGIEPKEGPRCTDCRGRFADLWDTINAKRGFSWDSNPWVWAVSFKEVK